MIEVGVLLLEEGVALLEFVVLLDGVEVHRAHRIDALIEFADDGVDAIPIDGEGVFDGRRLGARSFAARQLGAASSAGAAVAGSRVCGVAAGARCWRLSVFANRHAQAVEVALEVAEIELVALLDVLGERRELASRAASASLPGGCAGRGIR